MSDADAADEINSISSCYSNTDSSPLVDAENTTLEEILHQIGCENHIQTFRDNELDLCTVLLLEDEDIKELFPKIGQRLKFKKKLEELKLKSNVILHCTENKLPTKEKGEIPDLPIIYQDNYKIIPDSCENNNSCATQNNRASLDGRAILREGQIGDGILKEGPRRKLSQLLIRNILDNNPSKSIDTEEFYKLTTEICQLFPKDSAVVYYSAYIASADGVKKKNASGKLYESYISRRRKMREIGDLPKSTRSASVSSASSSSSISSHEILILEDDHRENISWLRNNVEPWKTVEKYWKETEELRLNKIKAGEGKIEDYFKDFPALQQKQGYTLLLRDFDYMFPEKGGNLFSKILLKKEDILKYAKFKLKATRDKYVHNTLSELLSLVDDTNPETSTNIALIVLPLVINVSPNRRQKKPTWKPSRAEVSQGFIAQVVNESEVTDTVIEKTEKLKKLGRTVQPYVISVGSSAADIKKAYVVINNTFYTFQKLITAVDCAFKIIHATGAYYPEESEDIWTTIQIGIYGITTKFDRKTQAVNVFLADLDLVSD